MASKKHGFWGREQELASLKLLESKRTSSLVAITGRRRIGKSTLVEEFGKTYKNYLSFQGLAPRPNQTNQDQLNNFAAIFSLTFKLPKVFFSSWTEAFAHLGEQTKSGQYLILLDEISWMGKYDKDFSGKLKIAWDTIFSKNKRLILIICGSVSTWIEKNILNKTDFVGRISLTLKLEELDLVSCNKFWGTRSERISNFEKLRILSILGGIPKYLEEINPKLNSDQNINALCFTKGGYLLEDFDRIFNDIFESRSAIYKKIINLLLIRKASASELAKGAGLALNRDLSEYLSDLELSKFIERDWTYKHDGSRSKINEYRIRDCYLRFYLKYIDPNKDKISKGIYNFNNLESLKNIDSILGLQFESLVLSRLNEIIPRLNIDGNKIVAASPHIQKKTSRADACQIDLLIHLKNDVYNLCEIKFKRRIGISIIKEVEEKIKKLKVPKNCSKRPMLIYSGELEDAVVQEDYFDQILNVGQLLENKN